MMAGFILIPNISAYVLGNLEYPRAQLGILYMCGGVLSFFSTQIGGRIVDRIGAAKTSLIGSIFLVTTIWIGFVMLRPPIPIVALFMLFMTAMGLRNVSYQTLASRVPETAERAGFMSIQSAVQHVSYTGGAFLSAHLLSEHRRQIDWHANHRPHRDRPLDDRPGDALFPREQGAAPRPRADRADSSGGDDHRDDRAGIGSAVGGAAASFERLRKNGLWGLGFGNCLKLKDR